MSEYHEVGGFYDEIMRRLAGSDEIGGIPQEVGDAFGSRDKPDDVDDLERMWRL